MASAMNHPLPPRPQPHRPSGGVQPPPGAGGAVAGQAPPGAGPPAGTAPPAPPTPYGARSPFLPASPRPHSPFQSTANSPRTPSGVSQASPRTRLASSSSSSALAPGQVAPQWPARLTPDKLRTNHQLLGLPEGWTVEWRAWTGPALMGALPGGAAAGDGGKAGTPSLKYDPLAQSAGGPVSKPTGRKLLEDLAAAEAAASRPGTPVASTSTAGIPLALPRLKDRLEALQLGPDPVEQARQAVIAAAAALAAASAQAGPSSPSTSPTLRLFAHVEVAQEPTEVSAKGKGKQKDYFGECQAGLPRTLWVFELGPHAEEAGAMDVDAETKEGAKSALARFEFPLLTGELR